MTAGQGERKLWNEAKFFVVLVILIGTGDVEGRDFKTKNPACKNGILGKEALQAFVGLNAISAALRPQCFKVNVDLDASYMSVLPRLSNLLNLQNYFSILPLRYQSTFYKLSSKQASKHASKQASEQAINLFLAFRKS